MLCHPRMTRISKNPNLLYVSRWILFSFDILNDVLTIHRCETQNNNIGIGGGFRCEKDIFWFEENLYIQYELMKVNSWSQIKDTRVTDLSIDREFPPHSIWQYHAWPANLHSYPTHIQAVWPIIIFPASLVNGSCWWSPSPPWLFLSETCH